MSDTNAPIRIVDLFSGAGGLSLGWLRATEANGATVVAAVDSDQTLQSVYEWNFPGTQFIAHEFGDPLQADESELLAKMVGVQPGDVDVLLAGPPCQSMSAAGKRTPHADSRLVFHVCDFAKALRPKIVLIENVPEFGRVQDGRLLGRVRVRLADAGYITDVRNLAAVSFGVPQTRVRCFTLGIRHDLNWPRRERLLHTLLTSRNGRLSSETVGVEQHVILDSLPPPVSVAEAIDDLPSLETGEGSQVAELINEPTSSYQQCLRDSHGCLFNHIAVRHSPDLVAELARLRPGEAPQDVPDHPLRRKDYFRAAYARLDPKLPAPTMTTQTHNPGSGRFTHYRDARVLTVREVARIQSFPDAFRFFGFQEVQRRHVGNAVPPLLSEAIARVLIPLLQQA